MVAQPQDIPRFHSQETRVPNDHRMSSTEVAIRQADLADEQDQLAVRELLNHYAAHLTGRHQPLPPEVLRDLIPRLRAHPAALVLLAECNHHAVGVATCFLGFSTFQARPLLNIHDLAVHRDFQNRGIGGALLEAIRQQARQLDCCAITLEVQANNPARRLYASKGFRDLTYPVHAETMLFAKLEIA